MRHIVPVDRGQFGILTKKGDRQNHWEGSDDLLGRYRQGVSMSDSRIESDERYRVLFEQAGDATLLIEPDTGRLLEANRNASTLLGYERDELVRMTLADFDVVETREETIHHAMTISKNGKEVFETKQRCKDGTIIAVEVCAQPVKLYDRTVLQSIWRNITERNKIEEALRQSERRYRSLFENIDCGVAVYEVKDDGKDFIVKDFNRAGEIIDDDDRIQLIGKSIFDVRPGIREFGIIDVFLNVWKTGRPCNHPVTLYKDENLVNWYENYVYRIAPNEIVAVFRNVTDQKRSEEELRRKHAMLSRTEAIAHVGSWEWEIGTDTAKCSDELFRILQLSPSDGAPRYPEHTHLCLAEDIQKLDAAFGRCLTDGTPFELELRVPRKGDGLRYCIARGNAERNDEGEIDRLVGSLQDITERKHTAEALQKSQKLESLGILAGGIAHDFNNLLSGIYGYTEMALETTTERVVSEYLKNVLATIERTRALTGQLLTFAKGGVPIKKPQRLIPFIEETVRFVLSGSNVLCQFHIPDDLWTCEFDRSQIGQVIDNLIINAIQAMPAGGLLVISAENTVFENGHHSGIPSGPYVMVSVRDHGTGIPEALLSKIFDPFFTTKERGHGLGLSTCHSIVTRHGGRFEVKSQPGDGSTFSFFLPALHEDDSKSTDARRIEHTGRGTFLLMDDEELIRDILGEMLKSLGYSVALVVNGSEAIAFFEAAWKANEKIAGSIFDLTVPGELGGKDAISRIREFDRKTPVFIASGYADDPIMADPEEFGFNGSICKPFKKSELAALLNRHLVPRQV